MTAKHVAWFSFKDGVSDDRIEKHMRAVRTLASTIPGTFPSRRHWSRTSPSSG